MGCIDDNYGGYGTHERLKLIDNQKSIERAIVMTIIEKLKNNKIPFGLMDKEMCLAACKIGITHFTQYDGKDFIKTPLTIFFRTSTFRLDADYEEPADTKKFGTAEARLEDLTKNVTRWNELLDANIVELRILSRASEMKFENDRLETGNERLCDALNKLLTWANAYPISQFPEPDIKKAAKVLKDAGILLDEISASNMRHLLKGVKRIIYETLT